MKSARTASACGAGAIVGAAIVLCGCGGKSLSGENDALRRERMDLKKQVESLTQERDELRAKLAEGQRVREGALPAEALAALPRCVGIGIEALSGWSASGRDKVVVYVTTRDGRGRFVPVAGELVVEVGALGAVGTGAAELSSVRLNADQLREAYRSGFMGTHYEVEVPVPGGVASGVASGAGRSLVLRAVLRDAVTGLEHRAERVVEEKRAGR